MLASQLRDRVVELPLLSAFSLENEHFNVIVVRGKRLRSRRRQVRARTRERSKVGLKRSVDLVKLVDVALRLVELAAEALLKEPRDLLARGKALVLAVVILALCVHVLADREVLSVVQLVLLDGFQDALLGEQVAREELQT